MHTFTVTIDSPRSTAEIRDEIERNLNDHAKGYIGDPDVEVLYRADIVSVASAPPVVRMKDAAIDSVVINPRHITSVRFGGIGDTTVTVYFREGDDGERCQRSFKNFAERDAFVGEVIAAMTAAR